MNKLEPWPDDESEREKLEREIDEAISGIRGAWKNMLKATNLKTFNYWSKEEKRLEKKLYEGRKLVLSELSATPNENAGSDEDEKRAKAKNYQHSYYINVTKRKRAQRRVERLYDA